MAYLKPPWFTVKVFNKLAMATGVAGTETLTLTARASGQSQKIPVISVDVDGTRYLVSTRGESQWVRNLRASPAVSLTTKVGTTNYTASEVPVPQRDKILQAYRVKAGKTVEGYFAKLPNPADHPVFSLTPR
jgi:deazaflavin-dependent oxidoreductase (nitroreductase family)